MIQDQHVLTIIYRPLIPAVVPPVVSVGSTTPTTIPLSWTSPGPVVDSYVVAWTSGECPDVDEGNTTTITNDSTSYTISGLQEGSSYTVNVTATNTAGSADSDPVTGRTQETSECLLTLGAHARGLQYLFCLCVCVFSLFWHLAQSGVQTAVSATSTRYGHEI